MPVTIHHQATKVPILLRSENDKDKQEATAVGFAQQWALSVDELRKMYEKYKIEQNATKAMSQVQRNRFVQFSFSSVSYNFKFHYIQFIR